MNDMELLIILLLFNALEDDELSFLKVIGIIQVRGKLL